MKLVVWSVLVCMVSNICGYNQFHVELAKQKSAQGQVLNVSNCDFRAAGNLLKGVNFSDAQMSRVNFGPCKKASKVAGIKCNPKQITDLSGTNFSGASLVAANLEDCLLSGSVFTGADIAYVNFENADLTGAKLDGVVNAHLAIFCNATMPDGKKCSGKIWKSKSGFVVKCNCRKKAKAKKP